MFEIWTTSVEEKNVYFVKSKTVWQTKTLILKKTAINSWLKYVMPWLNKTMIIFKINIITMLKFLHFSAVHCTAVQFTTVQGWAVHLITAYCSVDQLGLVKCRASKSCDHATARSRKSFQRLRKIWVFKRKNVQFTTVSPFLGQFSNFMLIFGPFSLRRTFEQKYWSRKKVCF